MKQSLKHVILRDELMKATRAFFTERKFCEVIPPVLNNAIPNEPNLYPFLTSWNRNGVEETRYLPTSPERALKIALSAGLGDCYAIGHCFRNLEGAGALHSPEFLMLEWYRVQSSYQKIMKEVEEYILYVSHGLSATYVHASSCHAELVEASRKGWVIISLEERFEKLSGTSYERLVTDDKVLKGVAKQRGYTVENASWRQIFDQILVNEIESHLPEDPVFLIDFPSRISPLCKKKSHAPHIAERFELYIGGVEIANGNNENTNVSEIRTVFEKETGEGKSPLDIQFLEALQKMNYSGNCYAGVGLGLDRLLMVMMGVQEIAAF